MCRRINNRKFKNKKSGIWKQPEIQKESDIDKNTTHGLSIKKQISNFK
jgi:hypothetical protein